MFTTKTGKGTSLAFFLILFGLFPLLQALFALPGLQLLNAQDSQSNLPVIQRLDPSDMGFRQYISDVQNNRRRLSGIRPRPEEAAEHLTIYQYTTRVGDDIFFLAARCNIPYSALVSLNRLSNSTSIEPGRIMLLPSCPGIFVPANMQTDLEVLLGASRLNREDSIELRINTQNGRQLFSFFPGADFNQTERAYFLYSRFRFPLRNYRITSSYGIRTDPFSGHLSMHHGIDLAAPEGTEVYAIADGIVTAIGNDPVYGIYIIISHSNNWTSLYGHLQRVETVLRSDVRSGNLIGRVGTTGQSTGPHLHFELRQDGRAFDPAGRLRP